VVAVSDIISYGRDREPRRPRWPRWGRLTAIAACVSAALAAALIWYVPGVRHHGGQAKPGALDTGLATQDDGSGAVPDPLTTKPALMTGQPLPRTSGLRLLLGGQTPAWLRVPSGQTEPITGLPGHGSYMFFAAPGGWTAQPPLLSPLGCETCAYAPQPVYHIADGSAVAARIGTSNAQPAAAADPGALWLVSYPSGADMSTAAGTAQEVSTAGTALGPRLRLPAGYTIHQGTRAGLLLVQVAADSGHFPYELWDPGTRRVTRSFVDVIAVSPAQIAWVPACTGSCQVHVLDLSDGQTREIPLPARSTSGEGAFSPDGQLLALSVTSGVTANGTPARNQLMVATVASGRVAAVPGATVGYGVGVDFGWQPGSRRLIADVDADVAGHVAADAPGQPEWQIAVWQPGDARLSVALARSPSQSWPVIDQGPY
jgi:hypothetical protein